MKKKINITGHLMHIKHQKMKINENSSNLGFSEFLYHGVQLNERHNTNISKYEPFKGEGAQGPK